MRARRALILCGTSSNGLSLSLSRPRLVVALSWRSLLPTMAAASRASLSPMAAPPAPSDSGQRRFSVLRAWLALLAAFLVLSASAFLAYPQEQVSRLLEHSQQAAAGAGCRFPCARRRVDGSHAPWFRAGCPYRCGGPWDEQDFGLAPHLVRALGATYGTLGLLAALLRCEGGAGTRAIRALS